MKTNKHYFADRNKLILTVQKLIKPVDVVLDIGCGIQPQNYTTPAVHICCEPFPDYIEHLQNEIRKGINPSLLDRSFVFLQATGAEIVKFLPNNSVDTVFLLDVIEHLEKEEGKKLLTMVEKVARCQVIVFTPLGFVKQEHPDGKDAWGLDGGSWQEHRSGWLPEDFDQSWETFIAEQFHFEDNLGNPYPNPFGAFYAIKTLPASLKPGNSVFAFRLRNRFHKAAVTLRIFLESTSFYKFLQNRYRSVLPKKRHSTITSEKEQ